MLVVSRVCKRYGRQTALQDISFAIAQGESISLMGESGSGKSTLSRLILALEKPTSGNILWEGNSVSALRGNSLYRDIQPVFQDNAGCLNPRRRIGDSLCEPMKYLLGLAAETRRKKARALLEMVELPAAVMERYPHELSGGQQKRVCIARAISVRPRLLILDEAVSGLDATVMVKVLELLKALGRELGCGMLFITHDIRAALYLSKKVAVMKDGQIVELIEDLHAARDFIHPFSLQLMKHIRKPQNRGGSNEKSNE